MNHDDRDTIDTLKQELNFIEKGGYGRSVRAPWQPTSIFQDSPVCLNYSESERSHPCSECLLTDFVPEEDRNKAVPCHHIPLNKEGDTIETLEWAEDEHGLEHEVKNWLRATIALLESELAPRNDSAP